MQFTEQAQVLIRDMVRAAPPATGQYVRIEGMGNMWLTPIDTPRKESFSELALVKIDGAEYKLGRRAQ